MLQYDRIQRKFLGFKWRAKEHHFLGIHKVKWKRAGLHSMSPVIIILGLFALANIRHIIKFVEWFKI